MLDSCKMLQKQSEAFYTFLWHLIPSLKHNFIAYRSSKVSSRPDCIFEIHQLWQSGFSRVYSNSCCSCWFEPEIIKIGQSSHKMYSNNILNFQESTAIWNACTKNLKTYWMHHVYLLSPSTTCRMQQKVSFLTKYKISTGLNSVFFSKTSCLTKAKEPVLLFTHRWIHLFPQSICMKWNAFKFR